MKKRKSNLPKISIVVPSFNKVAFIKTTLKSIIDQKYPNFEVIIQDGGSTDGSLEIIKEFAKKNPKTVTYVSKKDKGQLYAINKGFKKATGEILTFINTDDVYSKDAFFAVADAYLKISDKLWFCGYCDIIDSKGKEISSAVTKYKNYLLTLNNYNLLLMVNYICQPSTFITHSAYEKYGPFKGVGKYVVEYGLWLRLGKVQMPVVIKKNLASFRLVSGNVSLVSRDILVEDQKIVENFTKNKIILSLHKIHNKRRINIAKILK